MGYGQCSQLKAHSPQPLRFLLSLPCSCVSLMKASARSVRIAPKKANLVAKMVRGMPVPDAVESLRRTHKKAARIIEQLLRSAMANASHNEKQDAQMMIIKSIVVNQGQAYHRGVPMARGRTRPIKKYLSHISVTLGFVEVLERNQKMQRMQKNQKKDEIETSLKSKTKVKVSPSRAEKDISLQNKSSESSESSRSGPESPSGPRTAVSSASF